MKNFKLIIIIIFCLLLALPMIQFCSRVFPEPALIGAEDILVRPKLSWSNWFNSSLQNYTEAVLDRKLGLRGHFIKTDNQLNYWLFGEIHQKTKEKLVIGKDGYLFEQNYIDAYLGRVKVDKQKLADRVRLMKIFQEQLAKEGKVFLFVIAPSKANYFNEKIPDNQFSQSNSVDLSYDYFAVINEFDKQGINYWDGRKFFQSQRLVSPAPLFAKSGTHWTVYGSCLATVEILNRLSVPLPEIKNVPDCNNFEWASRPIFQDADLVELTNMWWTGKFEEKLAYPLPAKAPMVNNLKALIIGDSFAWNLLKHLKTGPYLQSYHFAYYFNNDYTYPDNKTTDLGKGKTDLNNLINDQQLVIVESNEAGLSDMGFGFFEAVSGN